MTGNLYIIDEANEIPDEFWKHPMGRIRLIDPKVYEKQGTAIGMYALPKGMEPIMISQGYGLFLICNEKDGYFHLASSDGSVTWRIKRDDVLVYS